MAKIAAIKSGWIVIGVVLIVQVMDSCDNPFCKTVALLCGAFIVSLGSWFIVRHAHHITGHHEK